MWLQVSACALLYGTDGKEHVHGLHASFGIAQTGNSRMACTEHQVLEIVRFVNEEMVDAHLPEIGHVICPVFYILFQLFKFGLKVFLSSFQPLLYPAAHFIALLLEYGEILFDAVYFLRIYFLLYFGGLGYFPNWSCVRMIQSQLLFLMSWNIPTRFSGVKSSLPGYSTLAFG